ncbi:MAG: hypothetical protein N2385_08100 [Chloroflexus sp.]|nr:hypothetical protein [Chloroflexus sp.]
MNQSRKPARNDVTGLKWAISATALAVTIGGWGWLAAQNPLATATAVVEQPAQQQVQLPAVPTLVPLNLPASDAATASAPAQPAVREVTIPVSRPAPVARTRSSR